MGFERCHPFVNFLFFSAVIAGTLLFQHPVFLTIAVLCALAYSIKRNGRKSLVFGAVLLPLIAAFALYYSSYTHFGITVLQYNRIGNPITLESLIYGAVLGFMIAGLLLWASCLYSVFTTDKVVYLFGRVSPRLSLFLAILLRMIPRIKKEARKVNQARQGIGRGVNQGSFFRRIGNGICIFSILITWTVESLATLSDAMRSRGSTLRGRTAFSIYRFDNRDRAYMVGMFFCLTLTMMAALLGQTDMIYAPRMLWISVSPFFAMGYAALCLMPLGLELWTQYRFHAARNRVTLSCF